MQNVPIEKAYFNVGPLFSIYSSNIWIECLVFFLKRKKGADSASAIARCWSGSPLLLGCAQYIVAEWKSLLSV